MIVEIAYQHIHFLFKRHLSSLRQIIISVTGKNFSTNSLDNHSPYGRLFLTFTFQRANSYSVPPLFKQKLGNASVQQIN